MGILRTNKISGLETPTAVTGSVVFDGTGDYLSLSDDTQFDFEAGNWTVEGWIYMNSLPSSGNRYALASKWTGSGNYSWICNIYNDSGNMQLNFSYTTGGVVATNLYSNGGPAEAGKWFHIAYVRDGSTLRQFVNGVQLSTNSISGTIYNGSQNVNIGRHGEDVNYMNGYISNLRILKGTALYTSNFTPPVNELQPIGDTVLLCCNSSTSAAAEATGKIIAVIGNAAASTVSPGLTRDYIYGTQFEGVARFDTQGYFVPPSGNTQNRYTLGLNEIVTSGLVLHLDAGNPLSYPVTGVGTYWNDLSGNNNHGILYNGVSYTENNRGALVFDGTNDYVISSLNLNSLPQVTFSGWIYTTRASGNCGIMGNDNNTYGRVIRCAGSKFQILNTNDISGNSTSDIPLNQWFNVVVTWSTSSVNFYLNATAEQKSFSGENAVYNDDTVTYFGSNGDVSKGGAIQYLLGSIAQVSIYNRVLTAAEVLQNYNALKGRYGYT